MSETPTHAARPFELPGLPHARISEVIARLNDHAELADARRVLQWQNRALEAVGDAVLITDACGEDRPIVYTNASFLRITGYSHDDNIGRNCRFLQGPDTDPQCVRAIRQALDEHRPCRTTILNYRKDGSPFWNDLRIAPLFDVDGTLTHHVAVINDISDRVALQQQLRVNEAHARHLFEAMDFGYCDVELLTDESGMVNDWRYLQTNEQFSQQSGFGNVVGKRIREVLPDIKDVWFEHFDRVMRTGQAERFCEYTPALDRWFDVHAFRLQGMDIHRLQITFTDVTSRKESEAALVDARNVAEAAVIAANSANQAKSEFLANMSHEIRSPLSAILGYADILGMTLDSGDDLQAVDIIRQNVDHLQSLLTDFLDLAKIEAGKLDVCRTSVSPDDVVEEAVSLMHVRALDKGLRLAVQYDGDIPKTIVTDSTRLRQILINLLSNAIKFTEPDPAGSDEIVLRVSYRSTPSAELRFDISDRGIGLTEEMQRTLFTPFTQADISDTRQSGGTGLGLTISRRLAGMLGGSLAMNSESGVGSTFSLILPADVSPDVPMIQPHRIPARHVAEEPTRMLPPGTRVLVVDDRVDIRVLLHHHLEAAGAAVESLNGGRAALDLLLGDGTARERRADFDVVLMDMQMPLIDGFEVTRRLRATGFSVPVVALTASELPNDKQGCLAAGCSAFLSKPIRRGKLVNAIAATLETASDGMLVPATDSSDCGAALRVAEPPIVAGALHTDHGDGEPTRLLIIEDDVHTAQAMQMMLGMLGLDVRVAHTGAEGIDQAMRWRPRVVITDQGLPDGSGRNVADTLRRTPLMKDTVLLALSGHAEPEYRNDALFDHYLIKPVSRTTLVSTLASLGVPLTQIGKQHHHHDDGHHQHHAVDTPATR